MIRWDYISKAVEYYTSRGYTYWEAPWIAPEAAIRATLDHDSVLDYKVATGLLVGSAEQSMVWAGINGTLPHGRYVSVTPCFRREPYHSDIRKEYFMKVELHNTIDVSDQSLADMIQCAKRFFERYGKAVSIVETHDGYDLEMNGIEIGSYGIRKHEGLEWVYGTGLAEPRFSTVLLKP